MAAGDDQPNHADCENQERNTEAGEHTPRGTSVIDESEVEKVRNHLFGEVQIEKTSGGELGGLVKDD